MATLLPAEQLRMALEMECRGYALYSRARALTNDPALRALLDDLCRRYPRAREYMLNALRNTDQYGLWDRQLAIAMAAEAFYPGGLMQVSAEGGLVSREAMLETAIRAERDSIAYYEKMLPALEGESAEMVRKIINEEEGHLRTLAQWRDEK